LLTRAMLIDDGGGGSGELLFGEEGRRGGRTHLNYGLLYSSE